MRTIVPKSDTESVTSTLEERVQKPLMDPLVHVPSSWSSRTSSLESVNSLSSVGQGNAEDALKPSSSNKIALLEERISVFPDYQPLSWSGPMSRGN